MNMFLKLSCTSLFYAFLLISFAFAVPAHAAGKVAVLNIQEVLLKSKAGIAAKKAIEKRMQELKKSLDYEKKKLTKLQDEMKKKASVWSDEKKTGQGNGVPEKTSGPRREAG